MLILGIESSCDDTSVALLDCSKKGCFVVSEKTISQIDIHKKYGGVVPEIAGRAHAEKIIPLIEAVLENQPKPDAIAVTAGPGLITGLLVGSEAARTLSYSLGIPLVAVNHIEGHIYSVVIASEEKQSQNNKEIATSPSAPRNDIIFPALALIVSGGHTELILVKKAGKYKLLGSTKDDAAGECFDKVAKLLNLPYPGGPQISKLAQTGNTRAIKFPRPMINEDNFDFSFSGLKTSALYWLRDNVIASPPRRSLSETGEAKQSPQIQGDRHAPSGLAMTKEDFCASFEQAIVDVLVAKTNKAAQKFKPKTIVIGGGVSANLKLRETLKKTIAGQKITLKYPDLQYCMDNAAMIAVAGYHHASKNNFTDWQDIKADPNWEIA